MGRRALTASRPGYRDAETTLLGGVVFGRIFGPNLAGDALPELPDARPEPFGQLRDPPGPEEQQDNDQQYDQAAGRVGVGGY